MGILVFILVITLVVGIHEMGHYLACRLLGIPVSEFSIGFGPRLTGIRGRVTAWNLRLLPLGGYVKMDEDALEESSPWKKALVAVAGPVANLLPFILAGTYFKGFVATMAFFGKLYWGTVVAFTGLLMTPFAWAASWFYTSAPSETIRAASGAMGPLGIGQATVASTAQVGVLMTLLTMFIMLSVGIALINLLPLPPLDGGRIVLAGVEAVAGKVWADRVGGVLLLIGGIALILFILIVTFKDIARLF